MDLAGADCTMHQGDKAGRSAIGLLVRSRKKTPVNPFGSGVSLYGKAHKMAAHFSYGTRRNKLQDIAKSIDGPNIRLQLDLSSTRVASIHTLFISELRMNKSFRMYSATGNYDWCLTNEE